jgi:RND family efflux transporter MFP subunit
LVGEPLKTTVCYPVSILLALLVGTSCSHDPVPVAAAAPASQPAPAATPPVSSDTRYTASGPIVVENQVDVSAQREGIVTEILVEPGARVRKGQLLAKLDDRQVVADLEGARARCASTEADLNNWKAEAKVLESDLQRARKMWDAKLITQEQFEHAQFKAEADQWDVKRVEQLLINARDTQRSLELELEKTQVTAPFDGIVARRYVRAGQTVARDERLIWVTATGPLRVRFTLPSRFVNQLKIGQRVAITVADGNPAVEHAARVIQMSPVVDPASGTIEVLAELTGAAPDLLPGMQADVHLPAHP